MYHESEANTSCVVDIEDDDDDDNNLKSNNLRRKTTPEEEEEEEADEYSEGDIISLNSSTGSFSCVGDSRLSTV